MRINTVSVAAGCLAAGTVAAVGIANASSVPSKVPDSSTGVITSCWNKDTKAVRYINAQAGKTCKSGEKTVAFNQTGPTGPSGPSGPTGPSNGYVTSNPGNAALAAPAGEANTIATLTLPAGNYLINAQTNLITTTSPVITCVLVGSAGTLTSTDAVWNAPGPSLRQPVAMTASLKTTESTTVSFRCNPSNTAIAIGATMTATGVGTLTGP